MGTFSGFSEDDIRKLQSPESSSKHLENNNKEGMSNNIFYVQIFKLYYDRHGA